MKVGMLLYSVILNVKHVRASGVDFSPLSVYRLNFQLSKSRLRNCFNDLRLDFVHGLIEIMIFKQFFQRLSDEMLFLFFTVHF